MTQLWNASPQESRGYLSNEFLQIYLYSDICGDDARGALRVKKRRGYRGVYQR